MLHDQACSGFLLKPVLDPAKRVIHIAEVIAFVTASLIGGHALAAGALKALMHDQISSAVAKIIDHPLTALDAAADPLDDDDATEPPRATGDVADPLG